MWLQPSSTWGFKILDDKIEEVTSWEGIQLLDAHTQTPVTG